MSEYMIFCLGNENIKTGLGYQQNYMVFNKKVDKEEYQNIKNSLPTIKISHTYWIEKDKMTDEEKKNNPIYKELGGYLKRISYEEAWANWWSEASKKDRQAILDIPQFDKEIFKGITGIPVLNDEKSDKKQELIDKAEELRQKADELLEKAEQL